MCYVIVGLNLYAVLLALCMLLLALWQLYGPETMFCQAFVVCVKLCSMWLMDLNAVYCCELFVVCQAYVVCVPEAVYHCYHSQHFDIQRS
jgi:hypothetical protein